ncbi:unnamed protein product [Prorocentrum cordatum]|uniref:Cyclic nucleotide-binding domain-containing protein n=1 Tax=Prorocentrum cordatum TaxID=2364126 RepID=A0ABN9W7W1_9DINO|nr:unnamed protein product [Polarella glacialis]
MPAASAVRPAALAEPAQELPSHSGPLPLAAQAEPPGRGGAFDDLLGQLAALHRQEVQAVLRELQASAALVQRLRSGHGEDASVLLPCCVPSEEPAPESLQEGFGKFVLSDAWRGPGEEEEAVLLSRTMSSLTMSMDRASLSLIGLPSVPNGLGSVSETARDNHKRCAWGSFVPASPGSPARMVWDFLGAVLIFYDLLKLPMETFHPPETAFSIGMDWCILCFWTLNVFASLTIGYVDRRGVVVLSMRRIALRYIRTWLAIDLLVLVPDWTSTIVAAVVTRNNAGEDSDMFRLLRVLRLVRMVRLLRLLKLRKILMTINDMIDSESVSVIANIVKMMFMLLVVNHITCCMWYAVSVNQSGEQTWIKVHKFEHAHWTYKYATAFHWSIHMLLNLAERVFTVVVVVLALVGFSYIVGSITGSLGQLRNMNAEESMLFWDLKRYLARNKVPRPLSMRIQKYLENAWQAQSKKSGQNFKLKNMLSEQLLSELKFEMAVPQLRIHPLLDRLIDKSKVTANRLANVAMGHKLLAAGDYLFHHGEAATHMFIVVDGKLIYARLDSYGGVHKELVEKAEDWIAEPVLWTRRWVHCGLLKAIEDCDNLAIDSKKFAEQVKLNPEALEFVSEYAQNFIEWLNNEDPNDLSDISQGENLSELLAGFIPSMESVECDNPSGENVRARFFFALAKTDMLR